MANGYVHHNPADVPGSTNGSICSASLIIGLVFVIVASLLAYFFSPKGENQTYVTRPLIAAQQHPKNQNLGQKYLDTESSLREEALKIQANIFGLVQYLAE